LAPTIDISGISISIGTVSLFISSSTFFICYSSASLFAASFACFCASFPTTTSTTTFFASSFFLTSFWETSFAVTYYLDLYLSSPKKFLFFLSMPFFFFLLFLSSSVSFSYADPDYVEVEMGDVVLVASSSNFFLASSHYLSSYEFLPKGLPPLLKVTSS
jgi:hypothetical protein